MKHNLLSFFALAGAMFMSASVAAWDEPVAPVAPTTVPTRPSFEGTWVEPEDGGTYYLYNVGSGQFLGAGQDWGTRAIATAEACVAITDDATTTLTKNKNYIFPFLFSKPSDPTLDESLQDKWMIQIQQSDRTDVYLCHEGNAAWVDGDLNRRNTDNNGFWEISAVDGGYELIPLDGQEGNTIVYGVHLTNLAKALTAYTWTDLTNGDATVAGVWKFVSADDAEAIRAYVTECVGNTELTSSFTAYQEELAAYNTAVTLYNAQLALYNQLLEADKYGVDATEAGAVYTNAESTVAQLNAATAALKEAIAPHALAALIKTSTEDNPVDITSYVLKNADFSEACDNGKTPPGWEITIKGQNVGQQNRTDTNSETQASITNFLEAWTPQPGTLGDGYAGQWLTGLPQGRYRLEMDATACQQSNQIAIQDLTGVCLFVGTGSYNIQGDAVQTGEKMVQHYTFDFDFNAEKLLVGLLVEKTNCNWISADNFKLYAIGEMKEDPNRLGLQSNIEKAEKVQNNMPVNNIEDANILNVSEATRTYFEAALEAANEALSGTSEEMKAASEALALAIDSVNADAAIYAAYQAVYNLANSYANKLDEIDQWEDLKNDLWEFAEDEIAANFNDGLLTAEGLAAAQAKPDELIAAFIGDGTGIEPGDDLTILVKNADFSEGSGATNIPGWTIASGAITELSASFHNIEAYHKAFDFQQTIKNLPKGTYNISVQGFVRIDGGVNDMVLYAGVSDKKFKEITDEYSEWAILSNGTDEEGHPTSTGAWPYDTQVSNGYQPNSMEGAKAYFETENPLTGKPFYLNEVSIAHTGGDLTIGVKCSATNLWILWDNFTLTFVSREALSGILEDIDALSEQLTAMLDEYQARTLDTNAAYDAIMERVAAKDEITTEEDAVALLNDIKALIETIKSDNTKIQELIDLCDEYNGKIETAGIEIGEEYIALLDEASGKAASYELKNQEEIDNYIQQIKAGWIPAVMANAQPGSDVTIILSNPDFELGNMNFWTITPAEEGDKIGDNQGFQNNNVYNNAENPELTLENFVEAWRSAASLHDGTISQTIAVALPAGAYKLGCVGYAVNQSGNGGVPEAGVSGGYLYAKVGESVVKQSICVDSDTATPTQFEVAFMSNGTDLTTVGLMVQGANFNWMAADNFTLTYLGKDAPDAVQNLNSKAAATSTIFTIDGRQSNVLRRGINIVRMSDGSVRKVLVK
ncbi:MAG: hypothetical protein K6C30_05355 [Bacteroidaceae bacterium]|nr:hypothetical protein [Bacteroidaceae bacterium]